MIQATDHDLSQKDAQARIDALDTSRSFIIQAPAGSGKTELLIQRTLCLLTTVTQPDRVLAVTFTKKACGEMRHRIQLALDSASLSEPDQPHAKKTWLLANQVLRHAQKNGWSIHTLAQNIPILTIDAMCQKLLRLSHPKYQIWTKYSLSLQPETLYREAYITCLSQDCLPKDGACHDAYTSLLRHHHLDQHYIERLLTHMLTSREQWLEPVVTARSNNNLIENMEATIIRLGETHLSHLCEKLGQVSPDLIAHLANHQKNLQELGISSTLDELSLLPPLSPHFHDLSRSKKIIAWLLTQKKTPRSRFTSAQGILSKKQLQNIDSSFADRLRDSQESFLESYNLLVQSSSLLDALLEVAQTPEIPESDEHWEALSHLLHLLPYLVARLQIIMHQRELCDFSQITLEVLHALDDDSVEPMLSRQVFDHYQHLLVDECQDISVSQHRLFKALLSEWCGDPMRSATLVGDPLQSIYRFRQADVGLFLHMQRHGLGDFPLNCLFLRHNYRSQRHLVEWINTCFSSNTDAMPNPIPHYPAHPTKPAYDSGLHFHYCGDDQCQNQTLGKLITSIRLKDPDASIGLLVRARSQLKNIIPYLENQSIAYRAVGIRSLAQSAFMYDCINLVLLGQNILNHTYWVALFRSPFCRLSWDDITRLCQTNQPLWQTLQSLPHTISSAGKTVLLRVTPILAHHFKQFGRHSPGKITHQTWHTLGGPYTLDKTEDYDLVEDFFRDVDQLAADHPAHLTQTMLERLLHDTSLTDQPQSVNPIEIMTVHKSKGLEFDYILCPSLHYSGAAMSKPLLDWMYTTVTSTPEILMHSPPKIQSHANSIHHYLRQHEQQCNQQEQVRLMYVALTRAKKSLHLLTPSTAEKKPSSQSWQSMLEPMLANPCHGLQIHQYDLQDKPAHSVDLATPSVKTTLALPADWQHPIFEAPTIQEEVADSPTKQAIITPLSQHQERLWGETVHRFLQLVSQKGLSHIPSMQHTLYALAHSYGVSARPEEKKLNWVFSKLCDMALDPQARWIFSPDHTEKMVEQTLFTPHTHRSSHTVRLDFSFISQGCRWIIDFKTSGILSESDKLTHTQDYYIEQYQPQLDQYQRFFSDFTPDIPVKLGLYFPLQRTWIPLD